MRSGSDTPAIRELLPLPSCVELVVSIQELLSEPVCSRRLTKVSAVGQIRFPNPSFILIHNTLIQLLGFFRNSFPAELG